MQVLVCFGWPTLNWLKKGHKPVGSDVLTNVEPLRRRAPSKKAGADDSQQERPRETVACVW